MRISVADDFEESGRDGLDALGCLKVCLSQPSERRESGCGGQRRTARSDRWGREVAEPMLDAGPLKLIVRAALRHDRRASAVSAPGILRFQLPGSELRRGRSSHFD